MENEKYYILFIIFFILFIISVNFSYSITKGNTNWNNCNVNFVYNKILSSNIYNQLKSGDIVLFSDNIKDPQNIIYGNNQFSHSGIIYKKNNIPYIYEIIDHADYPKYKNLQLFDRDVIMTPFNDRVNKYGGSVYVSSLIKPLREEQLNKFSYFINNDHNYKFLVSRIKLFLITFTNYCWFNERFCHEFVADILSKIDITHVPINKIKYKLSDSVVELCNGDLYSNIIQVIPDKLLINQDIRFLKKINYCI